GPLHWRHRPRHRDQGRDDPLLRADRRPARPGAHGWRPAVLRARTPPAAGVRPGRLRPRLRVGSGACLAGLRPAARTRLHGGGCGRAHPPRGSGPQARGSRPL
ncbi:MAG: hypothetical protein AVDCRST_MAG08-3136, partial [uncultured Acetobacteraceae bacterium]